MEQTVTEKQNCATCGVDVRPNSMFCYNCGGDVAVPAKTEILTPEPSESVSTSAQTSKLEMPPLKTEAAKDEVKLDEIKKDEAKKNEKAGDKTAEKLVEEPKLKSAASMRRQTKSFQKKNVEVVWEQPESSSLVRLLLVTLLLLIFAAVIVYLAVYNK